MYRKLKTSLALILTLLTTGVIAQVTDAKAAAAKILKLTNGARTKIVWQHQVNGGHKVANGATGANYELMAFDTKDGKIRRLLPGPASYAWPLVTRDGKHILYTQNRKIYILDFDGKNKKVIGSGTVLCTIKETSTGIQWVYTKSGSVKRFRIDKPNVIETVWSGPISLFRVSADGKRAGAEFPWPNAGIGVLPSKSWHRYGSGCNTDIAPDNSYRIMHLGRGYPVGHYGVVMHDPGGVNSRELYFKISGKKPKQEAWTPRWSNNVRFITASWPDKGKNQERQDIYFGEFNSEFTEMKSWVQVTNSKGQDITAHCWVDPGLGSFSGEVPFSIEFKAPGEGVWNWAFGDGKKSKASDVKHSYIKTGTFRFSASQGKKKLSGLVRVLKAKRPEITEVLVHDDKNITLQFNELVQLKDAKITVGGAAAQHRLDSGGFAVHLNLAKPLQGNPALAVKGIFDRAQKANQLAAKGLKVNPPNWPAHRSNLIFVWKSSKQVGSQYAPKNNAFVKSRMVGRGARFGPKGEMIMQGGVFFAYDGGAALFSKCRSSKEFTLELNITPENLKQGKGQPRPLILFMAGYNANNVNFLLGQQEKKIVLWLKIGGLQKFDIGTLSNTKAHHLVVTYKSGDLRCYINGKKVSQTSKAKGNFSWGNPMWEAGLNFGGYKSGNYNQAKKSAGGNHPWVGKMAGIAIYSKALNEKEISKNFKAYLKPEKTSGTKTKVKAKKVPRIKFGGKVIAMSKVPSLADIAPYRDALIICEFEVMKKRGKYKGKKIRVAVWGLRDGKATAISRKKPGSKILMVVERMDDHPELEPEPKSDTLEEDDDAVLYYKVD